MASGWDNQFGPRLKTALDNRLKSISQTSGNLNKIETNFLGIDDFRSVNKNYDNAVFWGAGGSFTTLKKYTEIPKILKKDGIFYGTVNTTKLPTNEIIDGKILLFEKNIFGHPTHSGHWSGIVIQAK